MGGANPRISLVMCLPALVNNSIKLDVCQKNNGKHVYVSASCYAHVSDYMWIINHYFFYRCRRGCVTLLLRVQAMELSTVQSDVLATFVSAN